LSPLPLTSLPLAVPFGPALTFRNSSSPAYVLTGLGRLRADMSSGVLRALLHGRLLVPARDEGYK
jgi:hypothetical protein